MQVKRHFSLKFVFLVPLVLSAVIFSLTIKNYYDSLNRDLDDEYTRIQDSLARSAKVLTAVDYSFSNQSKLRNIHLLEHNRQVIGGVCQMWPLDALLLTDGRNHEIPAVDINYMLVGEPSLCEPGSDIYERVADQVSLAPVLSFVHDIDSYLLGIHYIDKEGYIMSSPDTYAKTFSIETLRTVKTRPFWQMTANNPDLITLTGPAPVSTNSQPVMSMTMPIFSAGKHQGMLSLDVAYEKLLNTNGKLAGALAIINGTLISPPESAVRVEKINIEGLAGTHRIYYAFDLTKEVKNFFYFERYSLFVVVIVYLLSVIVLFFINTRVEHSYFKELAAKDPMTGLLNRRGFQTFIAGVQHQRYVAIAVFDIDNFKSINDTYGHDVGDNVISYMADQIVASIRDCDVAARFGGEEFVVYMSGGDVESLKKSMLRVQEAICAHSQQIIEPGFTVSGGVEVVDGDNASDFDQLFKAADEKLYIAKTSGKDQLVF
ncbi:GGDEF domain-containing protein [Vibrio sinaloensis]|uniref:GGDEF domain-containing protein n=1 Tax=Photobacterium sp. (strain ATCC 43367) TaxID=379097 RepID=UPI0035EAC4E5